MTETPSGILENKMNIVASLGQRVNQHQATPLKSKTSLLVTSLVYAVQ